MTISSHQAQTLQLLPKVKSKSKDKVPPLVTDSSSELFKPIYKRHLHKQSWKYETKINIHVTA